MIGLMSVTHPTQLSEFWNIGQYGAHFLPLGVSKWTTY